MDPESAVSSTEPVRDAFDVSSREPTPESNADVVSPSSDGGAEMDEPSRETDTSKLEPAVLKVEPGAETPSPILDLLEADFFLIGFAESTNLVGAGVVGVVGGVKGGGGTDGVRSVAFNGGNGNGGGGLAGSGVLGVESFSLGFSAALPQQPPILTSLSVAARSRKRSREKFYLFSRNESEQIGDQFSNGVFKI